MNRFAGLGLLGPYLRPYRGRVALALLSLLVAAGTVLAFGACLRALIDRGFAQGRPDVLNYALASLLAVAVVLAIASGARFYLVSWLGERVVGDLRRDLFAHVVRLGPAWFEIKRSGDVMSRISADAQLIEQVIGSSASVALRNTLMCVGGMVMLVITNPKLALLVLAVVPLVVAPIILFGRKVRRAVARGPGAHGRHGVGRRRDARRGAHRAGLRPGGARRPSASARPPNGPSTRRSPPHRPARRHDDAGDLHRLRRRRLPVVDGRPRRAERPHQRRRSHGLRLLCRAGGELGRRHQRDHRRPAARRRRGRAAGRAARRAAGRSVEAANPKSLPRPVRGACASRMSRSAIRRGRTRWRSTASICSVAPGETVAIVGPSGAGKTTVFNLLLRFYDPETGTIRIDGVDIRDLRFADLRGALAIVPQEPVLFTASSPRTSATAGPTPTDAEVRAAAEAASALAFIEALPQGFDTDLGARGVRLSGGQRQRIAIARALLRDPAILLLDEATSALDAESELAVQQALDRLMHRPHHPGDRPSPGDGAEGRPHRGGSTAARSSTSAATPTWFAATASMPAWPSCSSISRPRPVEFLHQLRIN